MRIPLFPLNLFLLPGDKVQLYIFEERYKQLIEDCLRPGSAFGIPFSNRLNSGNYGCLVEVVEVLNRFENGEMDILIQAKSVFKLQKFSKKSHEKLYPSGDVSLIELPAASKNANELLTERFKQHLLDHDIPVDDILVKTQFSLLEIVGALGLNDVEKIDFINIKENDLNEYLLNYIRYLDLLYEQESNVFQDIYLN